MNRFRDCDGHGTHVASLVAGNTVGVNPHATVYSLKVFPQCSSQTSASNLLGALAWLEWNFRPPGVVGEPGHDDAARAEVGTCTRSPS